MAKPDRKKIEDEARKQSVNPLKTEPLEPREEAPESTYMGTQVEGWKPFWERAAEAVKQGKILVPRDVPDQGRKYIDYSGNPERVSSAEMWAEGRPGATTLGAEGKSYQEFQDNLELARHPGAVDILPNGAIWYGGTNELEEIRLHAEAAVKYGTMSLATEDFDEVPVTGDLVGDMNAVEKALHGRADELAKAQESDKMGIFKKAMYDNIGKDIYYPLTTWSLGLVYKFLGKLERSEGMIDPNITKDVTKVDEAWEAWRSNDTNWLDWRDERDYLAGAIFASEVPRSIWRTITGKGLDVAVTDYVDNTLEAQLYIQNHPGVPMPKILREFSNPEYREFWDNFLRPTDFALGWAVGWGAKGVGMIAKTPALRKILGDGTIITKGISKILGKNVDELGRLAGLSDETAEVVMRDGMVKAVIDDSLKTADDLAAWAKSRKFYGSTNDAKAAIVAEGTHRGINWMYDALGQTTDASDFFNLARVVGRLAGGGVEILEDGSKVYKNIDEVDDALRSIMQYGDFEFWFTRDGQRASYMIRQAIETKPEKLAKIVKEIGEETELSAKLIKMLKYSYDETTIAAKKFFPTVSETLKAGGEAAEEIPRWLKAASKAHDAAQKYAYGPLTRFWSYVYLGKSPGYGVRNVVQNTVQQITDLGFGSLKGMAPSVMDDAQKMAGLSDLLKAQKVGGEWFADDFLVGVAREMGALESITPGMKKAETLLQKVTDVRYGSAKMEQAAGRMIFGHKYPKIIRKILTGPVKKNFMKMNIDATTAARWENLLLDNQLETKKVFGLIRKELQQRYARTLSTSGFSKTMVTQLDDFKLISPLQRIIDTSDNADDAVKAWRTKVKKLIDDATRLVEKETPSVSPTAMGIEEVGNMMTQIAEHGMPKAAGDAATNYVQANMRANDAVGKALSGVMGVVEDALTNTKSINSRVKAQKVMEEILGDLKLAPDPPFDVLGKIDAWDYLANRKFVAAENPKLNEIKLAIARTVDERSLWLDKNPSRIELQTFWEKAGLSKRFGKLADRTNSEVKSVINQAAELEKQAFWVSWREQNYEFADSLINRLVTESTGMGAAGLKDPDVYMSVAKRTVEEARVFDDHLPEIFVRFNLKNARATLQNQPAKLNRVFITEYARKYGIDFEGKTGAFLEKKLVNYLNSQLGTKFDDIASITGVAEKQFAEAMFAQSVGKKMNIIKDPEVALKAVGKLVKEGHLSLTKVEMRTIDSLIDILGEIDPKLQAKFSQTLESRKMLKGAPGVWTKHSGVEAKNVKQYNRMVKRVNVAEKKLADVGEEVMELMLTKVDDAEDIAKAVTTTAADAGKYPAEWGGTEAPSYAQAIYRQRVGIQQMADDVESIMKADWNSVTKISESQAKALIDKLPEAEKLANGMVRQARVGAGREITAVRDFILHNYADRKNFDTALSYIYPFHFWHSRNSASWAKRIATRPQMAIAYTKFMKAMKRANDDMPDWYKYNLRLDNIMGMELKNPVFINLQASVNPLWGVLKLPFGLDFNDPDKRKTATSRWLDDLSSAGPQPHTHFSFLYGWAQFMQGDQEAGAKIAGRLIPQTQTLSAITAALGLNKGRGYELDPNLNLQALIASKGDPNSIFNALGPYEANRVNMGLQQMVIAGDLTEEGAVDAALEGTGNPDYDKAHALAQSKRTLSEIISFIGGPGTKFRNDDEMKIMQADEEYYAFLAGRDYLDEHEVADGYRRLAAKYPVYINMLLLARKGPEGRDVGLIYNVLGRIPAGQSGEIYEAVGIEYEDVQEFYDSKGKSLDTMPKSDRDKMMAGMYELLTILAFPEQATRMEWKEASSRYRALEEGLEEIYGPEVFAGEDEYWRLHRDGEDPQAAFDYIDDNPRVGDMMSDRTQGQMYDPLLRKYYASFGGAKAMLNAEMYDILDEDYPGIEQEQDKYYNDKAMGSKAKASERLKAYWADKDALIDVLSVRLISYGRWLPEGVDIPKRLDIPEEEDLSRGELALRDLEVGQERPEIYSWDWEKWSNMVSPELGRLVQDWAARGAPLSDAAESNLEYELRDLGIPLQLARYLMRDAALEAGAEFYGPDNPPWWEGEEE